MAKKTQIKQKQKQSVTINIGNRAVKRRKPRKRQPKSTIIFPTSIINYPPNYVNPAVVQPLQQPEVPLVPRASVPSRRYAVYAEGETASHLNLSFNPVPFVPQGSASLVPVEPLGSAVVAPKGYVRLTAEQKAANKAAKAAGRQAVKAKFESRDDARQAANDEFFRSQAEARREQWIAAEPSAEIRFVGDEEAPPPLSGLERDRP